MEKKNDDGKMLLSCPVQTSVKRRERKRNEEIIINKQYNAIRKIRYNICFKHWRNTRIKNGMVRDRHWKTRNGNSIKCDNEFGKMKKERERRLLFIIRIWSRFSAMMIAPNSTQQSNQFIFPELLNQYVG